MQQEPNWLLASVNETITRLQQLIRVPSFSKEEFDAATLFEKWMNDDGITYQRVGNNLWAKNNYFDESKPTILLNSHLDTVKPNSGYTRNAFDASMVNDKLFGLGSTDAGGALMCLYQTFKQFYLTENLAYNLIFAATAEEEISGQNGIESIIPLLPKLDLAIVGEPTEMHLAIAEKGLLVLDCVSKGKAGHAARNEGENAIYKALVDIDWFKNYSFSKLSQTLGEVKMNVTMIQAGAQHNVIPAECTFTVDVRCTDAYTHQEILDIIQQHVTCKVAPRSTRIKPSGIDNNHPVVLAAQALGRNLYGSPTTSDQALIPYPSVKIGPGNSAHSHQADEFIYLHELQEGLLIYHKLLSKLLT
jgi:acetylornithine deacetylase